MGDTMMKLDNGFAQTRRAQANAQKAESEAGSAISELEAQAISSSFTRELNEILPKRATGCREQSYLQRIARLSGSDEDLRTLIRLAFIHTTGDTESAPFSTVNRAARIRLTELRDEAAADKRLKMEKGSGGYSGSFASDLLRVMQNFPRVPSIGDGVEASASEQVQSLLQWGGDLRRPRDKSLLHSPGNPSMPAPRQPDGEGCASGLYSSLIRPRSARG